MRALQEQPRLVVAKALGMLLLLGSAFVLGLLLPGEGGDADGVAASDPSPTAQPRPIAAQQTPPREDDLLRRTRAQLARSRAAHGRLQMRLRSVSRTSARLQRDLRIRTRNGARLRRDLLTSRQTITRLRRDMRASARTSARLRGDLRRVRATLVGGRARARP